ncbi:MAG TPA: hypothetical protein VFE21_10715 [Rubrobacteraceae bacterium]|nr:hypothetical protein [Rubrobacteraceae bacterium]
MFGREDSRIKEDVALSLTRTAETRVALFATLAAGTAAVLVSGSVPILLWQTPVFLALAAIAALLEKDCAIWLEMRLNEKICSRQDFKRRQRWAKNALSFYRLSYLCFAGAVLYLVPVIVQSR